MSDTQQGWDWWLASDGKWYPPQPAAAPPPPQEILTAKGVTGTVTFDGRMVTINRSRGIGRFTAGKGEKRIPLASITGIEWKPPGVAVRGFMRFTIPGGNERTSRVGRRTQDAAKDENSVLFGKTQETEFARLREAIENAIAYQ